jgi:hypothetical protein
VVGHLAHRHGIRVELRAGPKGVIAHIAVPLDLLADAPATPAPESDPARWLSTERPSLVLDGSAGTAGQRGFDGPDGASLRRGTPMRAEDVLGAGQRDGASVWWSRQGAPAAEAAAAPSGSSPPPTLNGAGLPVRVPMAHLPRSEPATDDRPAPESAGDRPPLEAWVGRPREEPDPHEVRGVLSRFYGGVHRAAAEDETEQRVT